MPNRQMREIKFRGKRKRDGKWVYGDFYHSAIPEGAACIGEWEVDPKTVGQYTGLKDREDVEVYEDDIFEVAIKGTLYTVRVTYGTWASDHNSTVYGFNFWDWYASDVKVVANAHDNPDLLP